MRTQRHPSLPNERKYPRGRISNLLKFQHRTRAAYSMVLSSLEYSCRSNRRRHSTHKYHHFDKRYCWLCRRHRCLRNANGRSSRLERRLFLLPRQSSLVKGGGQTQTPVVSLHRPPLKQALPSVPQTIAEQSSPANPGGQRHMGDVCSFEPNEQVPLFRQINPSLPQVSIETENVESLVEDVVERDARFSQVGPNHGYSH